MASIEQQLAQIAKKIKPKIQNAYEKEVYTEVVKIGAESVNRDVYSLYEPQRYERTGLLAKSWGKEKLDGDDVGISVFNTRTGTRSGEDVSVAEIIETGFGYEFKPVEKGYRHGYDGGERPFIHNTREEISRSGIHKEKLKEGLTRQGLKVR